MSQNAVFLNIEMLLRAADYLEKQSEGVKQKERGLFATYSAGLVQ